MANTYTADDAAKLVGYCNTLGYPRATSGDTINVPAGTYNISADLNPVPGVEIAGADKATVIIDGNGFYVTNAANDTDSAHQLHIHDLTVDDALWIADCPNVLIEDVETKNASGNNLNVDGDGIATHVVCRRVTSHDAGNDCFSAESTGGIGTQCSLKLIDCTGYAAGAGVSDQVVTTHSAFPVTIEGGAFYNNTGAGPVAAVGAGAAPISAYGAYIYNPPSAVSLANIANAYNCTISTTEVSYHALVLDGGSGTSRVVGCRVTGSFAEASEVANIVLRGNILIGNRTASAPSYAVQGTSLTTFRIQSNIIQQGATNTNRYNLYVQDVDTVYCNNNIIEDAGKGVWWRHSGAYAVQLANNIFSSHAFGHFYVQTTNPTWSGGYNLFENANSGDTVDYPGQTGDAFSATADLGALYVPRPGGNCDIGKGSGAIRPLGEHDLWGRPKLRADADSIGPVFPQREEKRNTLLPLVQLPGEMLTGNIAA